MTTLGWVAAVILLIGFTVAYWWFVWRPYDQKWKQTLADLRELHRLEQEAFDVWKAEVIEEVKRRKGQSEHER
jgi:type II secretory pathway component PulM